jgi:hypothetical protein
MLSVYQHWDPLQVCVVGRSYPPEFYSWIAIPHVRSLFEKIAIETEEDYQNIIKKLQSFGVEVLRPDLPANTFVNGQHILPPMTPRDHMVMIGETFYTNSRFDFSTFYNNSKDPTWPSCSSYQEFLTLPEHIQNECNNIHNFKQHRDNSSYEKIYNFIEQQNNTVKFHSLENVNGAQVTRIGRDLYFGTEDYNQDTTKIKNYSDIEFPMHRRHIVNTGGHSDGTFCAVCPGLIISLLDVPTYADTFPDWEVMYLPGQSWSQVQPFLDLKEKNNGRWWIPGFEYDKDVVNTVEQWLGHWTGYVEETVFDVNMLIIDPKNVMVFNYNKQVFDALERYGITPHIVPFRHRYFWDGGIHCVTSDLHRAGTMQDYFPQRG